jgi:hypothetical protein
LAIGRRPSVTCPSPQEPPITALDNLLANVIAAHGGAELWRSLTSIEAVCSADSFLFTTNHVPARDQPGNL